MVNTDDIRESEWGKLQYEILDEMFVEQRVVRTDDLLRSRNLRGHYLTRSMFFRIT